MTAAGNVTNSIALVVLLLASRPVAADNEKQDPGIYVVILKGSESSPEKLLELYPEITGSWPEVAKFNLLRAGRSLELSRDMLAAERLLAKLAGFYGETEVRRSFDDRYIPVVKNLLLREGDLLRTWRRSGGRILFEDGSFVLLRSNTRARLAMAGAKDSPSAARARLQLLEGTIWSRIEKKARGEFEIETPGANTIIRGTDFRVKVEASDLTRLEVLDGTVELRAGQGSVTVPAQKGILYQSGESPGTLETLPPAPAQLLAPQAEQVFRSEQFDHVFRWASVPQAQEYLVEIARDPDFFDLVEEKRVGSESSVRVRDLEPGTYFWRVTAVAASGFEGYPAGGSYFVFVRTRP